MSHSSGLEKNDLTSTCSKRSKRDARCVFRRQSATMYATSHVSFPDSSWSRSARYRLSDHCDPPTTSIFGLCWYLSKNACICASSHGASISDPSNCPTTCVCGSTSGKAEKLCVPRRQEIRLTSPALVSDSWVTIGIWSIHAAITTGSATYPHLQNTTSMSLVYSDSIAPIIHRANIPRSTRFWSISRRFAFLRYFPDLTGTNEIISGPYMVVRAAARSASRLLFSPYQNSWCGVWASDRWVCI